MVNMVPVEGRPVRLVSDRLLLRDLKAGDWPAVCALRGDPAVAGGLGLAAEGEGESRAWLDRAMHSNRLLPREVYHLAIVLRETESVVGWIGMHQAAGDGDAVYEVSFALLPDYWGKGMMTEAVVALLSFAFEGLKAKRVVAECLPENGASARVLEKVGMGYEGRAGECLRFALDTEAWRSGKAS